MTGTIDFRALPADATFLRIHGGNYVHISTADGGELYLTEHAVPFAQHLLPENWYASDWFDHHREPLAGTSTVYKISTRPLSDMRPASLQLVVKWSRVGQDAMLNGATLERNADAEFNSPFEEFTVLEELRRSTNGRTRIFTQKPLGIYVPNERMQLWQSGRSQYKLLASAARHPGIELDIQRSYILLYGWIEGIDAVNAYAATHYNAIECVRALQTLTTDVHFELARHGFIVSDHKPTHIIVRIENGRVKQRRDGSLMYAIVDYELLARTASHREGVLATSRQDYLTRQRDRFLSKPAESVPQPLHRAAMLGTDYIVGRSDSTGGVVWVVGHDAELFNYFLPEQWHIRQVRLSDTGRTFYAQTKDGVHIVWKISRVGEIPPADDRHRAVHARLDHGYNSPFEEVSLALEMQRAGAAAVYPRAIYMTGAAGENHGVVLDDRRFERMHGVFSPLGQPALPLDHDYVTLWGYFRGLDDAEAVTDERLWTPIDAGQAVSKGLIDKAELPVILDRHAAMLAAAGFLDLNLKPDHVLLCYVPSGPIKRDATGDPMTRHCNFEFVRRR